MRLIFIIFSACVLSTCSITPQYTSIQRTDLREPHSIDVLIARLENLVGKEYSREYAGGLLVDVNVGSLKNAMEVEVVLDWLCNKIGNYQLHGWQPGAVGALNSMVRSEPTAFATYYGGFKIPINEQMNRALEQTNSYYLDSDRLVRTNPEQRRFCTYYPKKRQHNSSDFLYIPFAWEILQTASNYQQRDNSFHILISKAEFYQLFLEEYKTGFDQFIADESAKSLETQKQYALERKEVKILERELVLYVQRLRYNQQKALLERILTFRSELSIGDESHCGTVLAFRDNQVKLQSPDETIWLPRTEIYPKDVALCRIVNGRYEKPYVLPLL